MADSTIAELRIRALQLLHVLEGAEVADAEDATLVDGVILSTNEKLRDLGVAYWTDSAFPLAVKEDLAMYVACHAAHDFMSATEALGFRQANEERALGELRRLTASRERVDRPTRAEYF